MNYIDGFVLPIAKNHLEEYKNVASSIAAIWKEYGATYYCECIGDELNFPGTRSFLDCVDAQENDIVIFGWVVFPSKAIRDAAHRKVESDARMIKLVEPLLVPDRIVFDASRMFFGGFQEIINE